MVSSHRSQARPRRGRQIPTDIIASSSWTLGGCSTAWWSSGDHHKFQVLRLDHSVVRILIVGIGPDDHSRNHREPSSFPNCWSALRSSNGRDTRPVHLCSHKHLITPNEGGLIAGTAMHDFINECGFVRLMHWGHVVLVEIVIRAGPRSVGWQSAGSDGCR